MLSDANIRMNGKNALMSIQQTHQELTPCLRQAEACLKLGRGKKFEDCVLKIN